MGGVGEREESLSSFQILVKNWKFPWDKLITDQLQFPDDSQDGLPIKEKQRKIFTREQSSLGVNQKNIYFFPLTHSPNQTLLSMYLYT